MKAQYNFSVKKSLKDHLVQLPLRVMMKCREGTSLSHSAFLKLPLHANSHIQFKIPLSIPQGHSEFYRTNSIVFPWPLYLTHHINGLLIIFCKHHVCLKYLFIWLQWVLVMAHGMFSCGMWDRTRSPAMGAQSLSHWTTTKVSVKAMMMSLQLFLKLTLQLRHTFTYVHFSVWSFHFKRKQWASYMLVINAHFNYRIRISEQWNLEICFFKQGIQVSQV